MRDKGRLTTAALIVAILVLPLGAQARMGMGNRGQSGMMGRKGGNQPYLQRCLKRLNLTENQKQEIADILTRHKGERDALNKRLEKAMDNLWTVMSDDSSTEGQVRAAWRKVSSVREDMLVLRHKVKREVFKVLTPQQQEQIKEMASKARKRMNKRRRERERMIMDWLRGEVGK